MKQVTVRMTEGIIEQLNEEVKLKNYANRSDLIRSIIREYLRNPTVRR